MGYSYRWWDKMDDMDLNAIDLLAKLFPQADALGIEVPADMPLDTGKHQRLAVAWLHRRIADREQELGRGEGLQ